MAARTGLVMAVYVAVGLLLALGQAKSAPVVIEAGESKAVVHLEGRPIPELTLEAPVAPAPAPAPAPAAVPTTTTSTVEWASGRVTDDAMEFVPVSLEIPSLRVTAPVVQTGIDLDSRQMAIPRSPAELGWYRFGPRPGELGSAVIAGHVDMAGYGPGAFFDLHRLLPGDRVLISMSDGTNGEFEVVDVRRVPKDELDVQEIFDNNGPARVTLITCGGAFNHTERTYLDNVVASLEPVGSGA